ncbi:uncharacterized protein CC84DRAFT_1094636 [Paraphaeosphaeria sporulosa]|uniref:Up-regulated during septation protein 1 domain-containing protein n=1 Tax=Paraphaeosphaeria sporulosa TaxID=1460663 RepID=A0A177CEI2_9PLEO|nr:uncharacterized protein CC84DRAFT_1094636 [Paraphaeosphaeria sporulosa]OAG05209.1 hypothetical protein CC84DRAFT_1094636 [Paraphaeosphaeria sporulosa]
MTHIANCMRPAAAPSSPVYITMETSFLSPVNSLPLLPDRSPSILSPQSQSGSASRYQLWPSKSPATAQPRTTFASDKLSALSVGRSSSSLSDTVVSQETVPFWQRSGSLARRRKVSVPELGSTMTTVQEMPIDSPTIPGRPPLRKASTEVFGHERSSSAPGTNWRAGPFGDALMSCVTGPSPAQEDQSFFFSSPEQAKRAPEQTNRLEPSVTFGKPLSPILSPGVASKPTLKVDTDVIQEDVESPPEVPPKSPAVERKGSPSPLKLNTKTSRSQLTTPATATSGGMTPMSAFENRRSPNVIGPLPTPLSAISNPFSAGSPGGGFDHRASPKIERRDPLASHNTHNRNLSESSVMDRGRPVRRASKRSRSRTASEANEEPAPDTWQLPKGMRVADASRRMQEAEKETLYKQASEQAEKFEVMNKRDVASMSRELRALDERCDYLRKTYKSLRAGRQKLHSRMISYLKRGNTVIFSRESLLKQEEALAELDVSIDEFILKLEQAENRRLRLRQKLLEHVAAALVLNPAALHEGSETTPPRSPVKMESPLRNERKEVESIKIYADGHVLNLFSDIEHAIGKMCEQAY